MNVLRFLTSIIFIANSILAFAEYDGRLADDPYHKSPTWLYILIVGGIIYVIVKGLSNNSKSKRVNKSTRQNHQKTPDISHKKYRQYGRYWEECPSCKGKGWIDGKEVWYLVSPPENICCEKCKGYGHQLTTEAERLHDEYLAQYNKEQAEVRREREQREKQHEEEQRKINEERWQKKQEAIENIKAAGRKVLKEDEYTKQLEELRAKRKELVANVTSMLKDEPICPTCQNTETKKNCPDCRGTGHVLSDVSKPQIDTIFELTSAIRQLSADYLALYNREPQIPLSLIEHFIGQNSSSISSMPQSTLMRNRIVELLKDEPYCRHCMAAGHLKVEKDYSTNKAYEQVACSRCNGSGRLYYD